MFQIGQRLKGKKEQEKEEQAGVLPSAAHVSFESTGICSRISLTLSHLSLLTTFDVIILFRFHFKL